MLGTKIKETLIHGAKKEEIVGLIRRAEWIDNTALIVATMSSACIAKIPPQALAAHMLIIYGDQCPTVSGIHQMGRKYHVLLALLGDRWKDRLQAALFAVGAYQAGYEIIFKAMDMALKYDNSLGVTTQNFRNWMYVQDFLWHIMKPPEKARSVRKLMFTLIEVMCMIADKFPDDLSPQQRLVT